MITKEGLEDITKAPSVVIPAISATKMDPIKQMRIRMPIKITLKLARKCVGSNNYLVLNINLVTFLSKDSVGILR